MAFSRTAELIAQYLLKGNGALIEGRLQFRQFETKDGHKVTKHEIVVENVQFLDKPREQEQFP